MPKAKQPIKLIEAKGKKHLSKAEKEFRENSELKVDLKNIKIPKYITGNLKREFEDIASKLLKVGIMTELDEDCLARYLIAKKNYIAYTRMLNKGPKKYDIDELSKISSMQDKAYKQCRSSASDLGLSISSRCKLIMPPEPPRQKENKFSKFLE